MTTLHFTMVFYAPYLSATGQAADGYDLTLDLEDPVRESHLKGVMSDAAARVLRLPPVRLEQIFGSPANPSPWRWQITSHDEPEPSTRYRVGINDQTHTSEQDMLVRARAGHLPRVSFDVYRTGAPADPTERLALTCSARAVHRLGGQRRRGFGWVGIDGGDQIDAAGITSLRGWVAVDA